MNKEEILEMSRSDNRRGDERQKQISGKGARLGFMLGTVLCVFLGTVERGVFRRSSLAIWLIYFGMEFAQILPAAIDSKKKSDIAAAACMGAVFLALAGIYAWKIMTVTE